MGSLIKHAVPYRPWSEIRDAKIGNGTKDDQRDVGEGHGLGETEERKRTSNAFASAG
jgi:hypothetical protein